MTKILGIISARAGSKGLPRKNILPLAGKPLVVYTIEAAQGLGSTLYRLLVSTDGEEIAAVARDAGAEVPFLRPPALARDDTPSLLVTQHAVQFVEREDGSRVDWVLLLQPTSPLRTTEDLSTAIALALRGDATAIIGVREAQECHPLKLKIIQDGFLVPYEQERFTEGVARQNYEPPVYKTNGAIYLVRRDILMEEGSLLGARPRPCIMPAERSIDIDTPLDFAVAELLLRQRIAANAKGYRL